VRVALAINVRTAPLAFLIGANSLGSLIFPGIALNNQPQLLLGAACGTLITEFFTQEQIAAWAWRLPFAFGLVIVPIAIYI
ncbi:hypothetical protein SB783_47810, partial [Paraburkholderia sp. SIMBA_009]